MRKVTKGFVNNFRKLFSGPKKRVPYFFVVPSMAGKPSIARKINGQKNIRAKKLRTSIGPKEILCTNGFLDRYRNKTRIIHVQNSSPKGNDFLFRLGKSYAKVTNIIVDEMEKTKVDTQVMIGGDHSTASPALAALLERKDPEQVGVIIIDSHGDIHNAKSSPSKNFHGMWLRAHISQFDVSSIEKYAYKKLPTKNVLYIGDLDLEPEEQEYITKHGIQVISKDDLVRDFQGEIKKIREFIDNHAHLHLSIDIDAMDKTIAPGTGIPAEDGLLSEQIFPILEVASEKNNLSIDLTEVDPEFDGSNKTVMLAQSMLHTLLC